MATQPYNDFLRNAPAKPAQSGWPTASQAQSVYSQSPRPAAAPLRSKWPTASQAQSVYSQPSRPAAAPAPATAAPRAANALQTRPNFTTPTGGTAAAPRLAPKPILRGAGKLVAAAEAIDKGTQAVTDFQAGDNLGGGFNALRAGAATAAGMGNPAGIAATGGFMAGDLVSAALPQGVKDRIGSTINSGLRMVGGGVDSSAMDKVNEPGFMQDQPLTPEQRLSRDIINNPTQRGTVVQPLTPEQKTQAVADTNQALMSAGDPNDPTNAQLAAANPGGRVRALRQANGVMSFSDIGGAPVTGDVSYVDPRNNPIAGRGIDGTGRGGGVTSISAENFVRGGRTAMQPALSAARAQALREGRLDDVRASFSEGGAPRRAESTYQQALREMRESGVRMTGTNLRAAMNDLTSQRNTAAEIGGRLRENQLQRESDMAIAGARRERNASYVQAAGGDTAIAAQLALRAGDTEAATTLQAGATSQQALATDRTKNAMESLERFMDADEKGDITEVSRAAVRSEVENIAPGYFDMSEAERRAVQPKVEAALGLLRGANATRNNSFLPRWLTGETPAVKRTTLPSGEELAGATFEPIGRVEGALRKGVEFGDSALRIRGQETPIYIPAAVAADQAVLEYLKSRGVNIKGLRDN